MKVILCWFGKHKPLFEKPIPIEVLGPDKNPIYRIDPCLRCRNMVASWYYEYPKEAPPKYTVLTDLTKIGY